MNELILYNYFRSSTSYRARIALHYKNLKFEYKPVHLLNNGGEQHQINYRHLNPMGEVPTLVHNGKILGQSMAIIEYLDDVFPTPSLFPKDAFQKAQIKQFCENINSFMHPLGNLKVLQYLEKHHGYDQKKKEAWIGHWLHQGFQALEKMITPSSQFCFNNQLSAADVFLIPQIFTAQRFNVALDKYEKLMKINEHCTQLEYFQKAHPFRQIDTPPEAKI